MDIAENLSKNQHLKEAVTVFQGNPTQDNLLRLLTVVAARAKEGGMWMAPVGEKDLYGKIRTEDGETWYAAYTNVDEADEDKVTSIVSASILQHLEAVLADTGAAGLMLNPWTQPMAMEKNWIRVILNAANG